jgi:hypothetical protein
MPAKIDLSDYAERGPAMLRAQARRELRQVRIKHVMYSILGGGAAGGIITLAAFWLLT